MKDVKKKISKMSNLFIEVIAISICISYIYFNYSNISKFINMLSMFFMNLKNINLLIFFFSKKS